MGNIIHGSTRSGSFSQDVRKHYGPGAFRWTVNGVLPQVGIALIEAAELRVSAMVVNDIGSCLLRPAPWGDRAVLHGPAVEFNADGEGRIVDDPGYADMFPKLDITSPEAWRSLTDHIDDRGGARLVIVHLRDPEAVTANADTMRELVEFVIRAQCCLALVTGEMSDDAGKLLRDLADSVLCVQSNPGARVGRITQTKGRGALGEWQFSTADPMFSDEDPIIEDVRGVLAPADEAARVH